MTNITISNIDFETGYSTFLGGMEMSPDEYQDGGWKGYFLIRGLPGSQAGTVCLRGTGSLKRNFTRSSVKHVSGAVLNSLFPDACDGNVPVGGSHGRGFVIKPDEGK